jgi:hypothetical protein
MILHPAVIALLTGSLLVGLMVVYAAFWGYKIIDGWDLRSGSERQLTLEKKTYLISTLMTYAFGFQILSFFLFVFLADDLHRLFVGAMCAAGTLNVNEYGYPVVVLKVLNCLLAGVWLTLNHTDNQAPDYPLIRKKYALLLAIVPFILVETEQLWAYFLSLKANVITSCCGSLFSAEEEGVAAGLAALPVAPMQAVFFGLMAAVLAAGIWFLRKGKGGTLFAAAATLAFPVSVAALISFISLYFYELPTHHCPFCILQREYHYVGYLIYAALLGGGIAGAGVWALMPLRSAPSLKEITPRIQRRLAGAGLLFYAALTAVVAMRMLFSDFVLSGYY